MLLLTGFRLSEIQKLRWEYVDLGAGELRLRGSPEHQGEGVGDQAAALARGVLREMTDAEEKIGMTVSGRAGRFGITATAVWMETVIALAAAGYRPNARR